MLPETLNRARLDFAKALRLRGISDVYSSILLYVISSILLIAAGIALYFGYDRFVYDVLVAYIGFVAMFSVVRAETKGVYRTRGGKDIVRNERPERFRQISNMLIAVGLGLLMLSVIFCVYGHFIDRF